MELNKVKGPFAMFRRKVRQPTSITLTPPAHVMLSRAKDRTGLSKADIIEALIRQHADSLTREQVRTLSIA